MKRAVNFVFEDIDNFTNFIDCKDANSSGISRFTPSPVATGSIRKFNTGKIKVDFDITSSSNIHPDDVIIVSTGVAHSPWDWCGYKDLPQKYDNSMQERFSVLYHINKRYLEKLQNKTAFLLLDQTHEGYHVEWLYEWFHDMCSQYNVSPSQIIYTTGELDSQQKYNKWCKERQLSETLTIIPSTHFEHVIHTTYNNCVKKNEIKQIDFFDCVKHKKQNLKQIKLFNALQKRPRAHRAWLFSKLYDHNLLGTGICTMNVFEQRYSYYEGRFIEEDHYNELINLLPLFPNYRDSSQDKDLFESQSGATYITDLNTEVINNSWITIVSEAQFAENTCFISEKTFKPIVNLHPFIIYGNKNSLMHLKEMGYRTFDRWWDESYDSMDTWDRLDAIIGILEKLKGLSAKQLFKMYQEMKPVLLHNLEVFNSNSLCADKALLEIAKRQFNET